MADNMNYLYTAGAYATLIGAGYFIYQVSTSKTRKRLASAQAKPTKTADAEPRKEDRKKKQRMASFTSEAQEASKKATKATGSEPSYPRAAPQAPDNHVEETDNIKEFAKQLAKAQEGHKLSSRNEAANGKQSQKSIKQSRANEMMMSGSTSKQDSMADAVGSDASYEKVEPAFPETKTADPSGVADMLESTPAAPSVLRLTNTEEKEKKKVSKPAEKVETKKQRQNRKKVEAARAAREETEQQRKVLQEQQRRQARIAEGRPAKDGSQYVTSNGNKSAWNEGTPNGKSQAAVNGSGLHDPLDTFEKPTAAPAVQPVKTTNTRADSKWTSSLPSEEEQLEMLKDEADEWNTVPTKASKKSSKKVTTSDSASAEEAKLATPEVSNSKLKPVRPAPTTTAKQSFGSFSALTSKDDPAEELEEEWDV